MTIACNRLGLKSKWKKIHPSELIKVNLPVLLLIGLNSESPHYVVLKGIKNKIAFLADPIRGNIYIPYKKLITEGINQKHPAWFVMAIIPSRNRPKDTTLYLSDSENERLKNHVTLNESSAITLVTLSRSGQIIINYNLTASSGKSEKDALEINSHFFTHQFDVRYGLSNDLEVGAKIQYSDNEYEILSDSFQKNNIDDKRYALFINKHLHLSDLATNRNHLNLGTELSYGDSFDAFGGKINITAYQNSDFAQFILGGSIGKEGSNDEMINNQLPEYTYSGFIGANKTVSDRFLYSMLLSITGDKSKQALNEENTLYSASTGFTYIFNKKIQLGPSLTYSFGDSQVYSFGINIAYIGNW